MRSLIVRCWRKILGVFFIVGGIIGLFLPILQGIAMIVAGAALLGNKKVDRVLLRLRVIARSWLSWWRER